MRCVGNLILILFLPLCVAQDGIEKPKFRVMAPQFVCPKDNEALIEKPDETVIMIQKSADVDLDLKWTVRWTPLPAPSQRFTLLLWRTIRALEAKLNEKQPVPYVYVIENDELLHGVNYLFTAQATTPTGVSADPKTFHIDNSQGDRKLNHVEGSGDQFSINILGTTMAYADIDYVVEAKVTTCQPTEDYYFQWTVKSESGYQSVNVSQEMGARLLVPANSMQPDLTYDVSCIVKRVSNDDFITQTGLPFQVLRRGLEVYLSADHLQVGVETSFLIEAAVLNHDFYGDRLTYLWTCIHNGVTCDFFENENEGIVNIYTGLPSPGSYEFAVTVTVERESGSAKIMVTCVEAALPVLQITPVSRSLSEKTFVSLEANATNVAPNCKLTWYFTGAENLDSLDTCTEPSCQHGNPLETLSVFSLEENFLNELTDFTNETEWRQVTASMPAHAGQARFVAECGCSLSFNCETQGMAYAEINFLVNEGPRPCSVMSSSPTGIAMETLLRISTLAVADPDAPLRYSFFCGIGVNSSLLLGFYYEHLSVETFLPYIEGGTEVWVEVCDARNACHESPPLVIAMSKGEGRTLHALSDSAKGHLRRCDIMLLQRVAVAALVTYTNTDTVKAFAEFSSSLTEMLASEHAESCRIKKPDEFASFLLALADVGFGFVVLCPHGHESLLECEKVRPYSTHGGKVQLTEVCKASGQSYCEATYKAPDRLGDCHLGTTASTEALGKY